MLLSSSVAVWKSGDCKDYSLTGRLQNQICGTSGSEHPHLSQQVETLICSCSCFRPTVFLQRPPMKGISPSEGVESEPITGIHFMQCMDALSLNSQWAPANYTDVQCLCLSVHPRTCKHTLRGWLLIQNVNLCA